MSTDITATNSSNRLNLNRIITKAAWLRRKGDLMVLQLNDRAGRAVAHQR